MRSRDRKRAEANARRHASLLPAGQKPATRTRKPKQLSEREQRALHQWGKYVFIGHSRTPVETLKHLDQEENFRRITNTPRSRVANLIAQGF